jgi:hypothetical protein
MNHGEGLVGQIFMGLITTLGGVVGILIGAAVIGVVVIVGLLPILFISRPRELREPDEDLRETHSRMSVHV